MSNKKKEQSSHSFATRLVCFILAGIMVLGVALIIFEKIFGIF